MRSLDECKAEIFRRSERKIKQRKKTRSRILAACIPLCLCIGIGAAGVLSGGFDAKSENMAAAPESAYMNGGSSWLGKDIIEDSAHTAAETTRPIGGIGEQEAPNVPTSTPREITLNGNTYLIGQDYETLQDILQGLEYFPHKVCRCRPQYRLETDFGSYGIHLSEGYARCDDGQADLTAEQVQTLRQIIHSLTESTLAE